MAEGAFGLCDMFVAAREGGYQDNASDPGNLAGGVLVGTNRGISAPVLATWLGRQPTAEEMRNLTPNVARAIRRRFYWQPTCAASLPAGVDLMIYDDAVNRGVSAAAEIMQAALAVAADGIIGPITLAAAQSDPVGLAGDLAAAQIRAYRADPNFYAFGLGWLRRAAARFSAAMEMIA